jgi:hypothetical protein
MDGGPSQTDGVFGRLHMVVMGSFRHLIVYPTIRRRMARQENQAT